jgi:DNA-binding transcriptional MerR regulator
MTSSNFENSQSFKDSYSFSEVSSVSSVKPYVLRFWETEFTEIDPVIHSDGKKVYSHSDLEFILLIKNLLFEQKMSIPQAKAFISKNEVEEVLTHATQIPEEVKLPEIKDSGIQSVGLAKSKLEYLLEEIDVLAKSHKWDI